MHVTVQLLRRCRWAECVRDLGCVGAQGSEGL